MPGIDLANAVERLGLEGAWGPETVSATTLDGVPYAPYSKGDKLGRMADWTQEGKEGRDRGGRQFNRSYRGGYLSGPRTMHFTDNLMQISKFTALALRPYSPSRLLRMNQPSLLSTTPGPPPKLVGLEEVAAPSSAAVVNEEQHNEGVVALSSVLARVVVGHKPAINSTTIVAEEGVVEVVDSDGKTTTSHKETETPRSTSGQTGR